MMRRIGTVARAIAAYIRDVMGDNDYQRYVALRRRTHPGEPMMTEREYWRVRHDAPPTARCC
ncbi:YbdD/YjiX family protein [Gordonia effusa]|uniref:YbdD/YjiX family protein n=1 Tax=Gordonia effusa TaxID=263908 RepID=UPI00278C2D51|nr:YbdD/YjiX family protein [Gordonia effusa]